MNEERKTAGYQIIPETGGNRYKFFCGQSGIAMCTTHPIRAETPEEELEIAWETEGRAYFNKCHKCGKWVSDLMFNVDTASCVLCSPWEDPPDYCPHCGAETPGGDRFCRRCGGKLQYSD